MDNLTKAQRSKNMHRIRSCDTEIEIKLRRALWNNGIRYRKNLRTLPGKPDIAITKYKIAIFCDSEFFHGKNWDEKIFQLEKSSNSAYWINKISRNIKRDNEVNQALHALGWIVLRFWGNDIKKDVEGCVRTVEETVFDIKINKDYC